MKNLYAPQFIESALSDFQVVSNNLTGDPYTRAEIIRIDTDKYMLEINKAYATGDRERFFALFQVILKQGENRDE
tara:strand:+ start:271 stop:495 length:225 start_codon:yes stop_codon:yes gene_type:complete